MRRFSRMDTRRRDWISRRDRRDEFDTWKAFRATPRGRRGGGGGGGSYEKFIRNAIKELDKGKGIESQSRSAKVLVDWAVRDGLISKKDGKQLYSTLDSRSVGTASADWAIEILERRILPAARGL